MREAYMLIGDPEKPAPTLAEALAAMQEAAQVDAAAKKVADKAYKAYVDSQEAALRAAGYVEGTEIEYRTEFNSTVRRARITGFQHGRAYFKCYTRAGQLSEVERYPFYSCVYATYLLKPESIARFKIVAKDAPKRTKPAPRIPWDGKETYLTGK